MQVESGNRASSESKRSVSVDWIKRARRVLRMGENKTMIAKVRTMLCLHTGSFKTSSLAYTILGVTMLALVTPAFAQQSGASARTAKPDQDVEARPALKPAQPVLPAAAPQNVKTSAKRNTKANSKTTGPPRPAVDLGGRDAGSLGGDASGRPSAGIARHWARAAAVGVGRFRNQESGQSQSDAGRRNHPGPRCHCGSAVVLFGNVAVGPDRRQGDELSAAMGEAVVTARVGSGKQRCVLVGSRAASNSLGHGPQAASSRHALTIALFESPTARWMKRALAAVF